MTKPGLLWTGGQGGPPGCSHVHWARIAAMIELLDEPRIDAADVASAR